MEFTRTAPQWTQALDQWIELHKDEIVQFLSQLVRIRTVNCPPFGDEWQGQKVLDKEMVQAGMMTDLFTLDEVPGLREHPAFFGTVDGMQRRYEQRPNLVGRLPGKGGGKSLMITGHMDTVVGASHPDDNKSDFSGDVVEGRLFGRGAYDMKAGLVCGLYAVRAIQALNIPLRGDVLLESVVDEEYGGANGTLASRLRGYQADIALCPEPTNMKVCNEHLGWLSYKFVVEGAEGLSFAGEAVENPLYLMSELVAAVKSFEARYPQQYASRLPSPTPMLPVYIMQLHTGSPDYASVIGIPKQASMVVGITTCLGLSEEMVRGDFEAHLRAHIESKGMDWSKVNISHPIRTLHPSLVRDDHPFFQSLRQVYRRRQLPEPVIESTTFTCDAFISNLYFNTPTVLLGPGGGNAHARDEYVLIDDVIELTKQYAHLMVEWCG